MDVSEVSSTSTWQLRESNHSLLATGDGFNHSTTEDYLVDMGAVLPDDVITTGDGGGGNLSSWQRLCLNYSLSQLTANFTLGNEAAALENGTQQIHQQNLEDLCATVEPPGEEATYTLPWWRQLIWSVFFVAMATTATCGNLIVIWIVMWHKRMRTVTNYFIVNLSIADTMVSSLNVTFNFVFMLTGHWPFGYVYCKICSFISIISVCGSVFTLVAIAADRYNAIVRPLKPRMGRPMTILVAVGIWIVAMAIAVPQLLYFQTMEDSDRVICIGFWPDRSEETGESKTEFGYNVCFMILTYFLPMSIMSMTYAAIAKELWGQQAIGECTAVQIETIKSKRRIVKMMIMLVMIFGVCWLPYHVYFIVSSTNPEINFSPYIQEIYLAIYWLAMSNSMYNPMIYCVMNNRFRQGFIRVFHFFCPCVKNGCRKRGAHYEEDGNNGAAATAGLVASGNPDNNLYSGIPLRDLSQDNMASTAASVSYCQRRMNRLEVSSSKGNTHSTTATSSAHRLSNSSHHQHLFSASNGTAAPAAVTTAAGDREQLYNSHLKPSFKPNNSQHQRSRNFYPADPESAARKCRSAADHRSNGTRYSAVVAAVTPDGTAGKTAGKTSKCTETTVPVTASCVNGSPKLHYSISPQPVTEKDSSEHLAMENGAAVSNSQSASAGFTADQSGSGCAETQEDAAANSCKLPAVVEEMTTQEEDHQADDDVTTANGEVVKDSSSAVSDASASDALIKANRVNAAAAADSKPNGVLKSGKAELQTKKTTIIEEYLLRDEVQAAEFLRGEIQSMLSEDNCSDDEKAKVCNSYDKQQHIVEDIDQHTFL